MRPAQREQLYNELKDKLTRQIEASVSSKPDMTFTEFLGLFSQALSKNGDNPASIAMSVVVDVIALYHERLSKPAQAVEET